MASLEKLTHDLIALEQELCGALVEVHTTRYNTLQESMAPSKDGLTELKAVVDRLRPLLWVWLHRMEETAAAKVGPKTEKIPAVTHVNIA